MTTITHESLIERIARVAQAERVTKHELGLLSREMLAYVLETEDVRAINALLGKGEDGKFVLTPINWRIAVQYFNHFVPFTSNYEEEVKPYAVKGKGVRTELVFKKKSKKRWDKCVQEIANWLEAESNDIWVWSDNAEMDAQPVDYAKKIQSAVKAAMADDKGAMSMVDVVSAIADMEDVSIHDLMGALNAFATDEAA